VLLLFADEVVMQTVPAAFVARKVALGSYKFKIQERDGKCDLVYEGRHNGTITLDIPPPCEFLRDRSAKVQRHRYWNRSSRGFFLVILVIGGPVDKAKSHELMKDGCATQTQAVSLSSRGVLAGGVGGGMVVCPLDGLDEVVFGLSAKPI
jgi:hypothetical protein